jgi:hypothetical protein
MRRDHADPQQWQVWSVTETTAATSWPRRRSAATVEAIEAPVAITLSTTTTDLS